MADDYSQALNSAYSAPIMTPAQPFTPVSIDVDKPAPPTTVSLDTGRLGYEPVDPETAMYRATKAHFGLEGIVSKTLDDYYQSMSAGREHDLRREVGSEFDMLRQQQATNNFTEKLKSGVVTPADLSQSTIKPSNPNTIFEKAYAQRYIDYVAKGLDPDAVTFAPTYTQRDLDGGTDIIAKQQIALREKEQTQVARETQSWPGFFVDMAKYAIPFYDTIKLSGLYEAGDESKYKTMGGYLEVVRQRMLDLPVDQYQAVLHKIMTKLRSDNPLLAEQFINAMVGQATNEKMMNTIGEAMNITGLPSIAKGLAGKIGRSVEKVVEASNAVKTSTRAATSEVSRAQPSVIAAPAAAGDLAEAGSQAAYLEAIRPNLSAAEITSRGLNQLTTNFRLDGWDFSANPGRFGQEVAIRIRAQQDSAAERVGDMVTTTQRVNRNPLMMTEENARAFEKRQRDFYKGRDNGVIDVMFDPIRDYDPISNTLWHHVIVGDPKGSFFKDRSAAEGAARVNGFLYGSDAERGFRTANAEYKINLETGNTTRTQAGKTAVVDEAKTKVVNDLETQLKDNTKKIKAAEKSKDTKLRDALKEFRKGIEEKYNTAKADLDLATKEAANKAQTPNPESVKTIYLDKNGFSQLAGVGKDHKFVIESAVDGVGHVHAATEGKFTHSALYYDKPEKGLIPLEVNQKGNTPILRKTAEVNAENASNAQKEITKLDRMRKQIEKRVDEVKAAGEKPHPDMMKRYLDLSERIERLKKEIPADGGITNYETFHGHNFGTPITEMFERSAVEGYQIRQIGNYFFIDYLKPIDVKSDFVRDRLIPNRNAGKLQDLSVGDYRRMMRENAADTSVPPSWFGNWINGTLGFFRTSKETLSIAENTARTVATHGPSIFLAYARAEGKIIANVPRKYWTDFEQLLVASQKAENPETKIPGKFFKSGQDIEDWYLRNIRDEKGAPRLPTMAEIEAYFGWKRNIELDRGLRVIAEVRNRASWGAETINIKVLDKDGKMVRSPDLDGKVMDHWPGAGTGDPIAILGSKLGEEEIISTNSIKMKNAKGKELQQAWKEGRKVLIELYTPEQRLLKDFLKTNDRIRYVLADYHEARPLSWDQVPRQGGGHLTPDYEWFIKQAKMEIGTHTGHAVYEGDRTLAAAANKAEAEHFVRMEEPFRQLIKENKLEEAKLYHEQNKLPRDFEDHLAEYQWSKDGKTAPRYDVNEPWRVVQRNKNISQIDDQLEKRHENFVNGTRQGSANRIAQTEFTQERDAQQVFEIKNLGSNSNPLWNFEPAKLMDPITAMDRGLGRIIQSTFMDDYKIMSIEHWLEQARPWLREQDKDLARASPFRIFKEGTFRADAPQEIVNILNGNRYKINSFLQVPSKFDTVLHSIKGEMMASIYKYGGAGLSRTGERLAGVVPDWLLHTIESPLLFARNVTFHAAMGLFSIPQLFTQFMTHTNIWALSPRHAPTGTLATLFDAWVRMNDRPEIMAHFDKLISSFNTTGLGQYVTRGFKPGEFTEMVTMLNRSGFRNIATEHAFLDTMGTNKIIERGVHNFLEWGQVPFRIGAGSTRNTAYFTAYLERRTLKPEGAFGRADAEWILQRAATLDHNMTRASSTPLHTGFMSVTMQFQAYALRVMEMMTGKQLTVPEKARLFFGSALLYGVPVGGLGLYGYPIADYIREKAVSEWGYVQGNKWYADVFMNGLPAQIMAVLTGGGDPSKGKYYNFSKFGTKGVDSLARIGEEDGTIGKLVGGAPYSFFTQLWGHTSALRNWMLNIIRPEEEQMKLRPTHFIEPLRAVSTINQIYEINAGFNLGRYLNKNDMYLDDTTGWDQVFQAISGLRIQDQMDVWSKATAIKHQKATETYFSNKAITEFHRGWYALQDNNHTAADAFFQNARANMILGGVPEQNYKQVLDKAAKSFGEPLTKRINWQLYMTNVPEPLRTLRLQMFQQIQQQK